MHKKTRILTILSLAFCLLFPNYVFGDTAPVLRMKRGVCEGVCPIYSIELDRDGNINYYGEAHVKEQGKRSGKVDSKEVERIIGLFRKIEFHLFPLNVELDCEGKIMDLPGVRLSVTYDGNTRTIFHDPGCIGNKYLYKLTAIENEIDRALNTAKWVGKEMRSSDTEAVISIFSQQTRIVSP